MPADLSEILGDLITVNHRLTRLAAHAARGEPADPEAPATTVAASSATESPAVWRTLSVLRQTGPIRLGELAARSRVSQPTATKLVTHLANRGWATRQPDPLDARVALAAVTAAGEAALADWRRRLAQALLPLFADLPPAEVETLERAIAILRDRVDRTELALALEPDRLPA
jgi:DNA-binding MarR family transcriptional regulator